MGDTISQPEEPERPSPDESSSMPGYPGPRSVRAEVNVDKVESLHHTDGFDSDDYVVARRDCELPVMLHTRGKLRVSSAALHDANSDNSEPLTVSSETARGAGTEVGLHIPATAAVGEYVLKVSGAFEDGTRFEVSLRRRVVVLFNAWSTNDGVFLQNEEWREEYVRNTRGRLYAGSLYGIPWRLALYQPDSLSAVLLLLKKAKTLSFEQRRNPILVAREMSAMVNVQDDYGVLVGNWSGSYEDGTSPSAWRGSGKILQEYFRSGGQPVRYGQCWVFSGVLLSVLRILGIPARSVTNFSSAHDTNRNRTIDEYYNEAGEKVSYLSSGSDSVWNFHVWNEVWMARPDLPVGFDGWQAVDATPQEESPQGGGYRTGPAPIKAVKEGNSVVYDTNFVIAEVNADIKKYIIGDDGAPCLFKVDTTTVGRTISTKAAGSSRREDLTDQYKYPEGDDRERRALYYGHEELLKESHDMTFEVPQATYSFGQDVTFTVTMTNKGRQHIVKGTITCEAVDYTGKVLREVKKVKVDTKVNKGKTESVSVVVEGVIFSEFTGTKVYLRFDVLLAVSGTSQVFNEVVPVAPDPPQLVVTAPPRLSLGTEARATVTFNNPLPVKMENVTLTIECDELLHEDIENVIGTIEGNAEFTFPFTLYGLTLGTHEIVAGLGSDQVELVSGEAEVMVIEGVDEPDAPQPEELEVRSVDLNLDTNRRVHHTDQYDDPGLIVRRGQLFSLSLVLASSLPSSTSVVVRAVFTLLGDRYRRPYSFEVVTMSTSSGNRLNLDLKTPADVAVGKYKMVLTVDNGGKVTVVDSRVFIIILFNPWSSEDTCYYAETGELREYVLNNQGRIWVGSAESNYGRPWQFAQFTRDSLEVALFMLDKLGKKKRKDPVWVTRHISAWVNVQDDNGVLVGNWSGDYSGGTSPLTWSGSAEILAQFNRSKRPVKYAQCWVFSGVETTLLRSVGLPARSITNFNSAHDTHFNRAIDKYFDESGEELDTGDSIWNFHVWNEAWMARPDLPAGFGGWQTLDATPQEESPQGGGYRLGPCPVRAVKLGQRMNFDVEFVISEVNADIRYYTVHADRTKTLTRVNTTHVGKNISTKSVGNQQVNIVTGEYKFRERSSSERAALLTETESEREIGLTISAPSDTVIGQNFTVEVTVGNKTSHSHSYRVTLKGRAMLYTGIPGQLVTSTWENITIAPHKSERVRVMVYASDYLRILEGGNFMHFVALVKADNDVSLVDTFNFRLRTPDIAIALPASGLRLYQPATIHVSFKNPLNKTLRNGKFMLFGESHVQDTSAYVASVPPQGIVSADLTTIPVKAGDVELVVRFSSNQLSDIMGDVDARVQA